MHGPLRRKFVYSVVLGWMQGMISHPRAADRKSVAATKCDYVIIIISSSR